MFWDWVSRVIFRRSRRRSMRELDVMTAEMEERMRHLNARIAKLYTKDGILDLPYPLRAGYTLGRD